MSVPNQARSGPQLTQTAGRLRPGGKRVYRMTTPVVVWWCWLGFLVLALADLLIQGHQLPSARIALGALTITGVVYAAALWPQVTADTDGICVRNPFRIFDIPWRAVSGVYLSESVEVQCARPPKKDKKVACWALAAPRRSRARAELRGRQWDRGARSTPSSYSRLPESARTVAKMTQSEVIARELARLKEENIAAADQAAAAGLAEAGLAGAGLGGPGAVNGSGPDAGYGAGAGSGAGQASQAESGPHAAVPAGQAGALMFSARWAWLPIAAILVPGIAFAIAMLVG